MVFQHGALFPHLDGGGQRRLRRDRGRERVARVPRARRPRRPRRQLPARALRRRAPARRAGPRAGRRPGRGPARRAVRRRSTPACARRCARRSRGSCARPARARCSSRTTRPRRCRSPTPSPSCATGRIEQVGTPEEVYERPRSRWLAEFLGDADVLPGTARDGIVECELGRFGRRPAAPATVEVVVRPESVAIGPRAPRAAAREARRGRALLLRARPARAPRAAERRASAQPPARLPRVAPGRPRPRVGRRAGHRRGSARTAATARTADRPGRGREDRLRRRVRADVRELLHLRALAADVVGAAVRGPGQRPQRAGAEVAVEVATLERRRWPCRGRRSRR